MRWIRRPPGARCSARCAISAGEGLAATAISAVDAALWDLKARLLGSAAGCLLGGYRDAIADLRQRRVHHLLRPGTCKRSLAAGSSATVAACQDEGRHATRTDDPAARGGCQSRRSAMATLFVDANGAYSIKQALALATRFAEQTGRLVRGAGFVRRSCRGLRAIARRAPAGMDIAAGEYAYTVDYVREHAGGRGRRRAAGRCDALRRHDRLSADRRPVRGVPYRPVRALRAGAASACRLRVRRGCGIWNGFTITSGSSTCCSTARQFRKTASSGRILSRPGNGLVSNTRTRSATPRRKTHDTD